MDSEPQRKGPQPLSYDVCFARVELINELLEEGYPLRYAGPRVQTALTEAARRLGVTYRTITATLQRAQAHGLAPDPSRFRPRAAPASFEFDDLPHDGEPDAETLIAHLKVRHQQRKAHDDAKRLMDVRINYDGPIGIVFFGDPHVDSSGTNWSALERDVEICRDTQGIFAISVGDARDNWVGRLMRLYANAETTAKQSLTLIEWLFTQLPWLLTLAGNHDRWGNEHGDAAEIIHRLRNSPGLYQNDGARLRLNLPAGCSFNMHVRHDFPGSSLFNGGHAFVRETLFGYRDHVLACGHRHSSAYIPIWHNDPVRLCQGFRCGSYKEIDSFQKEKHFKLENWAPSMGVVVNPDLAHDPVRFIERCFSAEEVADKLAWARMKWEQAKATA
jgi:hypothetical protein